MIPLAFPLHSSLIDSPQIFIISLPYTDSAQLFAQNIFNPDKAPKDVNAFWDFLYNSESPGSCSGVFCTLSKLDYFSQELLNGQNSTQNAFLYYGNRLLGQVSAESSAFIAFRPPRNLLFVRCGCARFECSIRIARVSGSSSMLHRQSAGCAP